VLIVSSRAGEQANQLGAVPPEHQNQRSAFYRELGARLQIVQARDDFG